MLKKAKILIKHFEGNGATLVDVLASVVNFATKSSGTPLQKWFRSLISQKLTSNADAYYNDVNQIDELVVSSIIHPGLKELKYLTPIF